MNPRSYVRLPSDDGLVVAVDGSPPGTPLPSLLAAVRPPTRAALELVSAAAEVLVVAREDGRALPPVGPEVLRVDAAGALVVTDLDRARAALAGEAGPVGELGRLLWRLLGAGEPPAVPDVAAAARLDWGPLRRASWLPEALKLAVSLAAPRAEDGVELLDVAAVLAGLAARTGGEGLGRWAARAGALPPAPGLGEHPGRIAPLRRGMEGRAWPPERIQRAFGPVPDDGPATAGGRRALANAPTVILDQPDTETEHTVVDAGRRRVPVGPTPVMVTPTASEDGLRRVPGPPPPRGSAPVATAEDRATTIDVPRGVGAPPPAPPPPTAVPTPAAVAPMATSPAGRQAAPNRTWVDVEPSTMAGGMDPLRAPPAPPPAPAPPPPAPAAPPPAPAPTAPAGPAPATPAPAPPAPTAPAPIAAPAASPVAAPPVAAPPVDAPAAPPPAAAPAAPRGGRGLLIGVVVAIVLFGAFCLLGTVLSGIGVYWFTTHEEPPAAAEVLNEPTEPAAEPAPEPEPPAPTEDRAAPEPPAEPGAEPAAPAGE